MNKVRPVKRVKSVMASKPVRAVKPAKPRPKVNRKRSDVSRPFASYLPAGGNK